MTQTYFAPHPALLEYVDSVFVLTIDFATSGLSPIYPFVPSHNRFLCFYLADQVRVQKQGGAFEQRARAIIIGPQLAPVTLDLGCYHQTVVATLKPAGLHRLLGIPLADIVDCDYDARLLLGPEIEELLDRLHQGCTAAAQNDTLQRYLLAKLPQLRPALAFDEVMRDQIRAGGQLSVEELANRACLSTRQFERLAHQRLGLPPKLYARLIRFSHAYRYKEAHPAAAWSDITYRCGYFDQAHFIRDFKHFAGLTPTGLLQIDVEHSVRFRVLEDRFLDE